MAGTTLKSELTGTRISGVSFDIADRYDDADIRHLLVETPMAGQISISLEREPSYFADVGIADEIKQTIVAYDQMRLVCMGSCAIRQRFVNGKPCRVGYLGGLRLDHRYAGRFDILRRGYEFFRTLQTGVAADFYFTSIAADNVRARNFLERGVVGMPHYEYLADFVTVLIPTKQAAGCANPCELRVVDGHTWALEQLIISLNRFNQRRQFAPCWSEKELLSLNRLGLEASDFRMMLKNGQLIACGAVWDQRLFKQAVIRNYAQWLKVARPLINGARHIVKGPRLPAIGETLANAFASHIAVVEEERNQMIELTTVLLHLARERQIEFLTLGLPANDPHLRMVRNAFSSREYRSRLYIVRWPGIGGSASEIEDRPVTPELALL